MQSTAQTAVNPYLLGRPLARLPRLGRSIQPLPLLDDADCRKSLLDIKRGSEIEPGLYLKTPRDHVSHRSTLISQQAQNLTCSRDQETDVPKLSAPTAGARSRWRVIPVPGPGDIHLGPVTGDKGGGLL